ncbi:MAG: hypothetical protein IJI37_06205, partial [Opitutales bacterium]|nr:hypothetical protein [Opitutales bacterium]
CRAADFSEYAPLTDPAAGKTLEYEREFLKALGGGCQSAYAANFDGEVFRFYHENVGIQKAELGENPLETVRALALGCV